MDVNGMFSYEWQANAGRFIRSVTSLQHVGEVKHNDTSNNSYKYTFNTVKKEGDGFVVTANHMVDRDLADNIELVGDAMVVGGFAASLTVVGAEVGVPIMGVGGVVSNIGGVIGAGIDLVNLDFIGSAKELFLMKVSKVITSKTEKYIPGNELGKDLIKGSTNIKLIATDRDVEEVISHNEYEENKNIERTN